MSPELRAIPTRRCTDLTSHCQNGTPFRRGAATRLPSTVRDSAVKRQVGSTSMKNSSCFSTINQSLCAPLARGYKWRFGLLRSRLRAPKHHFADTSLRRLGAAADTHSHGGLGVRSGRRPALRKSGAHAPRRNASGMQPVPKTSFRTWSGCRVSRRYHSIRKASFYNEPVDNRRKGMACLNK